MADINTQLREISIAHQHMVERYKNEEIARISKILDDLENEIRQVLRRKAVISKWTKKRQEVLLKQIQELQKVYHKKINDTIQGDFKSFGMAESDVAFNELAVVLQPLNLSVSLDAITPEKLYAAAKRNKILFPDGTTFTLTQMLNTFKVNDISRVKQLLQQGFILGETGGEMESKLFRIGGKYTLTRNNAKTIVRTGISHMGNTARDMVYQNNTDVVKGYQWISTLDSRTCLRVGSKVLTSTGYKPIEDISIGEFVKTHTGQFFEVQGTANKKVKELVEITLENDKKIYVTPEHYMKMKNYGFDWQEAGNVQVGDELEESNENR